MTREDSETRESGRRRPGPGLAARFTLGLGLFATLLAAAAGYVLLRGIDSLQEDLVNESYRSMTAETSRMRELGVEVPGGVNVMEGLGPHGRRVQAGTMLAETPEGPTDTRFFRVPSSTGPSAEPPMTLFAPAETGTDASSRMFLLVTLVTGSLILAVVIVGAWTARRIARPLNEMVEDVLAISRGRLDRRIRGDDAVGEVAHLAVAMDRMVDDLMQGQETERALVASQAEAENLRVLRRNLRPMRVVPPENWEIETRLLEAESTGSGDFSDALRDDGGRLTLVVGAPAAGGMSGALLMAMTRAYLRGAVLAGAEPAAACDTANAALNRDLTRGLYCSAMVLQVDPASGSAALVSTGHQTPAIRWDAAAKQWKKLQPNGIALGFDDGPVFRKALETMSLQLLPGDAIVLASPAVLAASSPSGKELGEGGLAQLAKIGVEQGLEAVEKKLRAFLGGGPEADLAFALIRRKA
ncbi:MAG: SpoIIE family protein phosphatase [Planctomycetota bacterium]|nr:SpoIIE family protein phosphatase [Planctomycetota bacterium]